MFRNHPGVFWLLLAAAVFLGYRAYTGRFCASCAGYAALPPDPSTVAVAGEPDLQAKRMPEWEAATTDGRLLRSALLEGQVVVVNFWASYCGPCVSELPALKALHERYGGRGMALVGFSLDGKSPTEIRHFVENKRLPYAVAFASRRLVGDFLATTGLEADFGEDMPLPTTLIYDREGTLVRTVLGPVGEEELNRHVEPLLRQETLARN